MSKLKELELRGHMIYISGMDIEIHDEIVAVVEAAERIQRKAEVHDGNGKLVDIARTAHAALAALEKKLQGG